jgi:ferredoxin/flavodoxin---NADP+ reductase
VISTAVELLTLVHDQCERFSGTAGSVAPAFSSPLSVAIVGAGPAGIHAAGALAELAPGANIDMFERLPTAYGLVR